MGVDADSIKVEASKHAHFTKDRTLVMVSIPNARLRDIDNDYQQGDPDEAELLRGTLARQIGRKATDAALQELRS